MPTRPFKLIAEVLPGRIFYCLNYHPPLKNFGGYMGCVYPDGGVFNLQFEQLQSLGTGEHIVEVDEKVRQSEGKSPSRSVDEKLIENVRLGIFSEQVGLQARAWTLCDVLLGFNGRTASQIIALLDSPHLEELARYCSEIPSPSQQSDGHRPAIVSSNGEVSIPAENLVALRSAVFRLRRVLQGPATQGIPDNLRSTVRMLRGAFPNGLVIDSQDYNAVCAFLDHEEWPHRAIAHVLDFAFDLGYLDVVNAMGFVQGDDLRRTERARMERLLLPVGLNTWRDEMAQEGR
jgi:hypothetical protein